jgi:uncharacterized protein YueI
MKCDKNRIRDKKKFKKVNKKVLKKAKMRMHIKIIMKFDLVKSKLTMIKTA